MKRLILGLILALTPIGVTLFAPNKSEDSKIKDVIIKPGDCGRFLGYVDKFIVTASQNGYYEVLNQKEDRDENIYNEISRVDAESILRFKRIKCNSSLEHAYQRQLLEDGELKGVSNL